MNDEIYNQIQEDYQAEVFEPKKRLQQKRINHKDPISEIVYTYLRGRPSPLLYQKAHDMVSKMLQDGWAYWAVEYKLKGIMEWGKQKNVHPLQIVKVLNKYL